MQSKEDILDKIYDLAFKYEAEIGSCPQCVLAAIYEVLDIGDKKTIQAADSLAGGTALSTQGTCGALVGGMLAIGSVFGREYEEFKKCNKKRRIFYFTKKLYEKFIEEYGSPLCCDIHKELFGRTFNLRDPKDYEEFEKAGAHVDKCPVVSGKVARWTAEILLENKK